MAKLTIPTYNLGQQVEARPLQARQTADLNPNMFGGNTTTLLKQGQQEVNKVAQLADSLFDEKMREANNIELLEVDKLASEYERNKRQDMLKVKLGAAKGLTTSYGDEWNENFKKTLKGFEGRKEMHLRVYKALEARRNRLVTMVSAHEESETKSYQDILYKDRTLSLINEGGELYDSTSSPSEQGIFKASGTFGRLATNIRENMKAQGFDDKVEKDKMVIDNAIRNAKSQTISQIINNLDTDKDYDGAAALLKHATSNGWLTEKHKVLAKKLIAGGKDSQKAHDLYELAIKKQEPYAGETLYGGSVEIGDYAKGVAYIEKNTRFSPEIRKAALSLLDDRRVRMINQRNEENRKKKNVIREKQGTWKEQPVEAVEADEGLGIEAVVGQPGVPYELTQAERDILGTDQAIATWERKHKLLLSGLAEHRGPEQWEAEGILQNLILTYPEEFATQFDLDEFQEGFVLTPDQVKFWSGEQRKGASKERRERVAQARKVASFGTANRIAKQAYLAVGLKWDGLKAGNENATDKAIFMSHIQDEVFRYHEDNPKNPIYPPKELKMFIYGLLRKGELDRDYNPFDKSVRFSAVKGTPSADTKFAYDKIKTQMPETAGALGIQQIHLRMLIDDLEKKGLEVNMESIKQRLAEIKKPDG